MSEQVLALTAVVVGAVGFIFSIILFVGSSRSRTASDALRPAMTAQTKAFVQQLAKENDLTLEEARLLEEELSRVLTASIGLSTESELRADAVAEKGDTSRKVPRTVEVQSRDGTRVDLQVDPSDVNSVHDFLDAARRVRGERVVAVH